MKSKVADNLSPEKKTWDQQTELAMAADCVTCFRKNGGWLRVKMFLCSVCGNKRCPKATDHRLQCTGSNEPGQAGSIYE